MIEETPVLEERTIVRLREDADLRIGEHKPAHQIVSQVTLDGISEGFLCQSAPGFAGDFVNLETTRHFFPGDQGLEHRVPDALREYPWQGIKAFQLVVLSGVSGQ